jgi:outer membrane protein OmpA-like peptidoglycan-associated protein
MRTTPIFVFGLVVSLSSIASAQIAPAPASAPLATPVAAPAVAPAPVAAPAAMPMAAPPATTNLAPPAATSAPPAPEGQTDDRSRGFAPQNSLAGSVGLLRMGSAEVGRLWQLRLGLHGEYFKTDRMLIEDSTMTNGGDTNTRLQGALTFGLTPLEFMEIFGAVLGSGNRNTRCFKGQTPCYRGSDWSDPEVIKAFGDLILGTKLAYALPSGLSIGGELGFRLMSSVGGLSFSGNSTSVWLTALASWNFQALVPELPLRAHLNLGMYFDNSYNLPLYDANTTLYSRYVSSFAYGLGKDRFRLAFGLDAPVADLIDGFSLRPMVEYHFEYVTADGDPAFASFGPKCVPSPVQDCRNNKSQMWLTLGLQAQILHSLTLMLGVDIELEAVGYPYGPPLAPWNFLFGASFPLDVLPKVVTRTVPVEKLVAAVAPEGLVAGRVVSSVGTPIEGAVVGVTGRDHSRVVAEADGSFQSVPLPPGLAELFVAAPNFENATARADVVAGQTVNVVITMTPRAPSAKITGHVVDETGKPVVATVKLAGPQIAETKTDEAGNLSVGLQPGQYVLRVEAEQHLSREMSASAVEGADVPLTIVLHARPGVAGVTYKDGKIILRQPIAFKANRNKPTAELAPGAARVLDELIDLLINHPEIRQIRVETHTDSSLPPPKAQELTDQQAQAIATYINQQGVPKDQILTQGMGSTKPRVPNLGKAGRVKNRRVEVIVTQ